MQIWFELYRIPGKDDKDLLEMLIIGLQLAKEIKSDKCIQGWHTIVDEANEDKVTTYCYDATICKETTFCDD